MSLVGHYFTEREVQASLQPLLPVSVIKNQAFLILTTPKYILVEYISTVI